MPNETPRLALDTFADGEEPWDHTDTVEAIDELAIQRGPIADRPATGDYDDQFYYAVDQRLLWRWDAAAGDWEAAGGLGTASDPIPGTSHFESLGITELSGSVAGDNTITNLVGDGLAVDQNGNLTVTSSGGGDVPISESGTPITTTSVFDASGSSMSLARDYLSTPDHYQQIRLAQYPPGSTVETSYSEAGAATTLRYDGTTYAALRQRAGQTTSAVDWELLSNSGSLLNDEWTLEWTVNKGDVANVNINSIEGVSLRESGGTLYFIFCWNTSGWGGDAQISYVSGSTPSDLETQLLDANNWTDIIAGKDPSVFQVDGTWYMLYSTAGAGLNDEPLIRSDSGGLAFDSYTEVNTNLASPYHSQFNPDNTNTGTVLYDTNTSQYLYWSSAYDGDDIYWYWLTADDVEGSWSYYDRSLMRTLGAGELRADLRYMDYYGESGGSDVIPVFSWDRDDTATGDLYVWDYSETRTAPLLSEQQGSQSAGAIHLTLDESAGSTTVADATGNGNSGSVPSEVTLGVSGQFDTAAEHDGSADTFIEVANDSTLEPSGEFSFSVWVYPTTSGQQGVLDMLQNYTLFFDRNGNQGFNFATYGDNVTLDTNYSFDQWHHVVVSWDVGNSVSAWINNTQVLDSASYTDTPDTSVANPLTLFCEQSPGSGNDPFTGRIDEARVFSQLLDSTAVSNLNSNNSL